MEFIAEPHNNDDELTMTISGEEVFLRANDDDNDNEIEEKGCKRRLVPLSSSSSFFKAASLISSLAKSADSSSRSEFAFSKRRRSLRTRIAN